MTQTDNLHLKKPGADDFYNVDDFNDNCDAIDAAVGELETAINQVNEDEISDDYIESLFADTNIGGSGNTPSASGGVTKAYVDAQDSKVLATALARIEGTDSTSQQDGNVITNSDIENIF